MKILRKLSFFLLWMATIHVFSASSPAQKREPDVEFVATPLPVVMEMLKMAAVTAADVVYDLGCGDGRIVITAAKEFGARGVGVDIDSDRIRESIDNARKAGVTHLVKFIQQDLFQTDISEATVVALYLLPDLNLKLRPKLLRELRPGARVLSHYYDMGDWKPDGMRLMPNIAVYFPDGTILKNDTRFYFWVIPANAAGLWRWSMPTLSGDRHYTLQLAQRFQELSGKIGVQGREQKIENLKLVGDRLTLDVIDESRGEKVVIRFVGRIDRDSIDGVAQVRSGMSPMNYQWKARRYP